MAGKAKIANVNLLAGELCGCLVQLCRESEAALRELEDPADACEKLATVFAKYVKEFGERAQTFNATAQDLVVEKTADGGEPSLSGPAVQAALDHPAVQAAIREQVLKGVSPALANEIRPDGIHGTIDYTKALSAVPRFGQQAPGTGGDVDPVLAKVVGLGDE